MIIMKDKKSIFVNRDFYFKKEEFCFYTSDKSKSFKDLYASFEKLKLNENSSDEYIFYQNCYYNFHNPCNIKFIFPDNTTKDIFISNDSQISYLISLYPNSKIQVKLQGSDEFKESEIKINEKYKEIKIIIPFESSAEYNKANELLVIENNNTPLSLLSPVIEEYIDNPIALNNNSTFKLTEERKRLNEFINKELENNNKFFAFCGPEVIGKSISIHKFIGFM